MSNGIYFRTPGIMGTKPLLCHVCGLKLIASLIGTCYELRLDCRRCRTEIVLRSKEPMPIAMLMSEDEVVRESGQKLQREFIAQGIRHGVLEQRNKS